MESQYECNQLNLRILMLQRIVRTVSIQLENAPAVVIFQFVAGLAILRGDFRQITRRGMRAIFQYYAGYYAEL